jgi:hypothetical protein
MKIDLRLCVEIAALAAIVVAVFLATDKVWAGLLAFAASLAYLAYVWEPTPITLTVRRPVLKGFFRGKKQVRNK